MNYIASTVDTGQSCMANVCEECPWRKKRNYSSHVPGFPDKIIGLVDDGLILTCHMTMKSSIVGGENEHRCRGLEHFKANTGRPSTVEPDPVAFESDEEALAAWGPKELSKSDYELLELRRKLFFQRYPDGTWTDEFNRVWVAKILQTGKRKYIATKGDKVSKVKTDEYIITEATDYLRPHIGQHLNKIFLKYGGTDFGLRETKS